MQRRIDLALMLDHELRTMQGRYEMVRRLGRERGASDYDDDYIAGELEAIKHELELRRTGTDAEY